MRQKAEYSDKYGCSIQFNCGGEPISKISHGTLDNKDIDGAQPKRFTAERARPHQDSPSDQNTEGKPTEGRSRFRAPVQPRNPLAPDYNLPPLPPPPEVEAQKFIRNTLDTSDIQGTKVRVPRNLAKPDNALKTSDIEGSQPKGAPTLLRPAGDGSSASLKPHSDMRMDVSDIATKAKQPTPRKPEKESIARVEDGLGKSGIGAERKNEYYESLRRHGSDIARARDQAQTTLLAAVSTTNTSTTSQGSHAAVSLETHFREIDKHNSGLLKPKEFETALQHSGIAIPKAKVVEVCKALGAASSSGMIAYQDVLTHLYDNMDHSTSSASSAAMNGTGSSPADGTSSNVTGTTGTTPPQWYLSRQRRIKTEVAVCMGQQPEATAASAALVETPQEKANREQRATGKKIQGLSRPGENGKKKSATSGTTEEINSGKDNYWFADYQKAADTPPETTKPYHGGGGDGAGGKSELWFSKAGDDEKAMKEMGVWRPTKDAAIGIDFAKRKNKSGKDGGGDDGGAAAAGQEPPPPKPLLSKPKQTIPTRKDRQMAEKDIERVRQLD